MGIQYGIPLKERHWKCGENTETCYKTYSWIERYDLYRMIKKVLPKLAHRRRRGDMIQTFKIIKGIENIPSERFFKLCTSSSTRGHSLKLEKPHCRTTLSLQETTSVDNKFQMHSFEGSQGLTPMPELRQASSLCLWLVFYTKLREKKRINLSIFPNIGDNCITFRLEVLRKWCECITYALRKPWYLAKASNTEVLLHFGSYTRTKTKDNAPPPHTHTRNIFDTRGGWGIKRNTFQM